MVSEDAAHSIRREGSVEAAYTEDFQNQLRQGDIRA